MTRGVLIIGELYSSISQFLVGKLVAELFCLMTHLDQSRASENIWWLFGTLGTKNEILNEKDLAPVLSPKMAAREGKEIVFSEIKNKLKRSTLYQKEKLRKAKEKRERKRKRKREESQEEGEVSQEVSDFCKQILPQL